jgi:thiamine transport system permease protein
MSTIIRSLGMSLAVSITIAIVDVIFGFPLAWILIRRDFRGKSALAAFIDAPLAIPTAGLGFSVALFWALTPSVTDKPFFSLNLIESPFLLLVLFHFTTTFPLMVKSLAAILEEIDTNLEIAGLTCGANKLTVIRTITLPLFRAGLATGLILVLAKSLSDTGGVVALLTTLKGAQLTTDDTISGTVLIDIWKHPPNDAPAYIPGLSMVAILMILISIMLLLLVNLIAMKAKFNIRKVWSQTEATLSTGGAPKTYNTLTFFFFIFMVQVPAFFIFSYVLVGTPSPEGVNIIEFLGSVLTSFFIGGSATAIGLLFGIPIAILITRSNNKWFTSVMDTIVNIPYIIPSAALGLSVSLFWTLNGRLSIAPGAELILVVLSHVAMTIPYIIRNTVGAMTELDTTYEEMARSLGAKPFQVFSNVTFPTIRPAVLAGSVMAFTRSVGETGATLAVSSTVVTAPVLIVNYVKGKVTGTPQYFEAALTTIILIGFSLILLFLVAKLSRKPRRRSE